MTDPEESPLERDLRRVLSDPGYRLPDRLVPLERVHAGAVRRRRRHQAVTASLAAVALVGLGLGVAHPWTSGDSDRGITAASNGPTSIAASPSPSSSPPSASPTPTKNPPSSSAPERSTQQSLTPNEQATILGNPGSVSSVTAISASQWWVATRGNNSSALLATTDGGSTFSVVSFDADTGFANSAVTAVRFIDSSHATELLANGSMATTSNAGKTWDPAAGGTTGFTALEAGGGEITWALRAGDKRELWRSERGGSWTKVATLPGTGAKGDFALLTVENNRPIVVWTGDAIQAASFDSAGTMSTPHAVTGCTLNADAGVLGAESISAGLGGVWLTCSAGSSASAVVLRSTDYGATWLPVPFSGQRAIVGAIDATHAVVASSNGFQTVDEKGSTTTTHVDGVNPGRTTYVGFTTSKDGFATTDQGYLVRSTDGGLTWKVVTFTQ